MDRSNLSHILKYSKEQIVTCYLNNIQMNYPKYIKKLANIECRRIYYNSQNWSADYEISKQERKIMFKELRKVKNDLFNYNKRTVYSSDKMFHQWLDDSWGNYYPIPMDKSKSLYHDLYEPSSNYLGYMIKLNIILESYNVKLYNPLCIRSSNIPQYIKIDTSALIDLLVGKNEMNDFKILLNASELHKKDLYDSIQKIKSNHPSLDFLSSDGFDFNTHLWKYFCKFGTNKHGMKILESGRYIFNNTIMTDGFGVSALQVRKDRKGTNCKSNKKKIEIPDSQYLDDLTTEELSDIKNNTNVVLLDPGKKNIMYMSDGKPKKEGGKYLRYTYAQRRCETRMKENKKKLIKMKDEEDISSKENNISYNSKSCILDNVIRYIKEHTEFSNDVAEFYNRLQHREMRYKVYKHTQISEQQLFDRIQKTFSEDSRPVTVVYGNWSCPKQLRNFAPTPGIGIRRKMSKYFKVYLLDEWGTSCHCSECHHKVDYCKKRTYKHHEKKMTRNIHGLLRCQNEECSKLWNRDLNATLNQKLLAFCILKGLDRPEAFKRPH